MTETRDHVADPCAVLSTRELLRLYSNILTELLRRGVVRSRNAPAGDLAEEIVRLAYDGTLAPPSEKGWDVAAADGRGLQVKCRVVQPGVSKSQTFSPFRSWAFDSCVFVVLDQTTYDVLHARVLDVADLKAIAQPTAWVNGYRVTVAQILGHAGGEDVADLLRDAYHRLPDGAPDPALGGVL